MKDDFPEKDYITGIMNRVSFYSEARKIIKDSSEYSAVIMDIDRFKKINENYGIKFGDALLKKIGSVYSRAYDKFEGMVLYGYFYADNFISLWKKESFSPEEFCDFLENEITDLIENYKLDFHIGIIDAEKSGEIGTIYDKALIALKHCKKSLGQKYLRYDDSMNSSNESESILYNEIKYALENDEFVPWFQPQYNYSTGVLRSAEALVRWIHPQKGLVPPCNFIPFCEKNDLIYELDKCVWEKVCGYLKKWKEKGISISSVSVNASRCDLYKPDFTDTFIGLIEKYDIEPSKLHIEITESAYVESSEHLINIVKSLQKIGFHVEMDDFGSGYSSLNMLKDVPVDYLKLDMGFMSNSGNQNKGGKILSSIVHMPHELNLKVIAEGVEYKQQAEYLKSIGCHYMQGYFFSRPLSADNFERLLLNSNLFENTEKSKYKGVDKAEEFLDATTQNTLIFNSFVGGAAIIEYSLHNVSALRLNDRFFEELGISRDDFVERQYDFIEYFPDENRFLFIEMLENAMNTGEEASCEIVINDDIFNNITVHNRVRFLAQQGESYIFYLTVENISERKSLLAEKAALTDRLSAIINNIPGIVRNYEYSERTGLKCIYSNDVPSSFAENEGESRKIDSDNFRNFVYYEDLPQIEKFLYDAVRNRVKLGEFKIRILLTNGKMRWVQINMSVTERKQNSIIISTIIINIDKQIKNEKYNDLYLHILSDLPQGIAVYEFEDENTEEIFINDFASELFGLSKNENSKDIIESIHSMIRKYDQDKDRKIYEKFLNGERTVIYGIDFKKNDGSTIWLSAAFQLIETVDSKSLCYAVLSDITDQLRSERILKLIDDTSKKVVYYFDFSKASIRAVDPKMCKEIGLKEYYDRESINQGDGAYILPESRKDVIRFLTELKSGKTGSEIWIHMKGIDGKERWYDICANIILNEEGTKTGALITMIDMVV